MRRRPRMDCVQVSCPRTIGEVAESAASQIPALLELAAEVRDIGKLTTQPGYQRTVVDRDSISTAGPVEFLCCVLVAEIVGGNTHEAVEAAKKEVQAGLLAGPEPPVEQPVDPVPDPAHVQEGR